MISIIRKTWQSVIGKSQAEEQKERALPEPSLSQVRTIEIEIAPNDPLMAYFVSTPGVVEIDRLEMDSPALRALKQAGIRITAPLVSQGELIGLLNLGPRLSEQEYSADDRHLLNTLATQAAPALRVAQLALQQQAEARTRERLEHELRVARIIQQTLLPKELPDLPGWRVSAHWQPARAVSGDFYDFFYFPDGRLGLVMGDVTDKGVPAALVMATTRSILRAAAEQLDSPAQILAQANDHLCPDIPANMFVTCLYLILDPASGKIRMANAGHNLPCQNTETGVIEVRATGMPLGLIPGMSYEEAETTLAPGDGLFIYSDGLVEAHNPQHEMFGFPRLRQKLAECSLNNRSGNIKVIEFLLEDLLLFTGSGWEQEDDVTFVTLERKPEASPARSAASASEAMAEPFENWRNIAEFTLPSEPGNEMQAMQLVASAVQELDLPSVNLERLKTAVAEATMNAMEHGNHYQDDLPVEIVVRRSEDALAVLITDQGGSQEIPEAEIPDLEAKLEGKQSPRGLGSVPDQKHGRRDEYLYRR